MSPVLKNILGVIAGVVIGGMANNRVLVVKEAIMVSTTIWN